MGGDIHKYFIVWVGVLTGRLRSCKVAWLVSGIRLERPEVCLLGEYEEGYVYGIICGFPWHPRHAREIFQINGGQGRGSEPRVKNVQTDDKHHRR